MLNSPDWNRARGKTIMLSELHALKLVEDLGGGLSNMTPFDVATMGILQGMLLGMELATAVTPTLTKENIDDAIAVMEKRR